MPDRVRGPVDAGRLAEPHADHAVEARPRERARELRAPHRGRAELLVDGAAQHDVVLLAERPEALELLIEAGERRALVARHERRGAQARSSISAMLVQQNTHQRLNAGQKDAPLLQLIAVGERDRADSFGDE